MTSTDTTDRVLVVTAGEYIDRNLPTASWWNRHHLNAGTYALEYVDSLGRPAPVERAAYAIAHVPTTLVETYRVNRLFTASSSETTHPDTPSAVAVQFYAYEVRTPGRVALDGHATVTATT